MQKILATAFFVLTACSSNPEPQQNFPEQVPPQNDSGIVPEGYYDLCKDPTRTPDWEFHCEKRNEK